jgi:SlyX protein
VRQVQRRAEPPATQTSVATPLDEIQTKIAFLERANSDLSDVVFRQQREIQALAAKLQEFSARLQAAEAGDAARAAQDERPPHY